MDAKTTAYVPNFDSLTRRGNPWPVYTDSVLPANLIVAAGNLGSQTASTPDNADDRANIRNAVLMSP